MNRERSFGAPALATAVLWCAATAAQGQPPADPGAPDSGIHLHMPGETIRLHPIHLHPIRHRGAETAAPSQEEPIGSGGQAGTPTPAAAAMRNAGKARAGAASRNAAIPFNFGEDATPPPSRSGAASPAVAPSAKTASLPPHPAAPARAAPASASKAADREHAGLTKRGNVLFEKGAADPSPAQFNGVKILADDLTTELESGATRVELDAFGGPPGDKSSDARRLALRRALAVRQLLIDNGVPSSRIDVRAMGGVDDKGPADRVDVYVRAG